MKLALAIFADFVESFLGESRLEVELGGRMLIAHTLSRAAAVQGADSKVIVVRARDETAARRALAQAGLAEEFDLLAIDSGQRPRRELIRAARKWNLDSWRGGLLGTSWFDEFVEVTEVARVLDALECEGALCIDGHQPLLDQEIAGGMLRYARDQSFEVDFVFSQAPPGLAGVLLRRETTRDLLRMQSPVGVLLSYRPEAPRMDLITKPMCYRVDPTVAATPVRFCADTAASFDMVERALADFDERPNAARLCAWARDGGYARAATLPVEIELELTTDDPLPRTTLRPRGARVAARRVAPGDSVARVLAELGARDDRLLWFGGFGDPLAHPEFGGIVSAARSAGVFGVGVATPLVDVSDDHVAALFDAEVDVLQVLLDAGSAATYQAVHGADRYHAVCENIHRILERRQQFKRPRPIVVPSLTRCAATRAEIEGFFDHWIRTAGWAVIEGYQEYGGLLPDDALAGTTPPVRGGCRRIKSRLTLLANGTAVSCDQDAEGRQAMGSWGTESLASIWASKRRSELISSHEALNLGRLPVCGGCRQWHRP
jgi:hypothetical protein